MGILGNVGKLAGTAVNLNPISAALGGAYAASGGRVGVDATPGYSATNVVRTQAAKIAPSPAPKVTTNVKKPGQSSGGGNVLGASTDSPYDGGSYYGGSGALGGGGSSVNTAAIRDRLLGQKGIIFDSANMAAQAGGRKLNSSILDFVDSLRSGQQSIDNKSIQNELARKQGQTDILGMINRGVSSGASVLRNANAGASSATRALADAYGDIGRRELTGVNQQYELGNRDIAQQQTGLDAQRASGNRSIQNSKQDIVDNIVSEATNSLAALDAQLIDASLPDRIAIEQEKANIRNTVMSQLGQFDDMLARESGGVQALSPEARMAQASQLATAGTAPDDAFDYSTDTPMDLQGTGPFAGDLPLFTYRRKQQA
jgi:hypothetical protein